MSLPSHEIAALLPLLLPALGGILILLLVAAERDRGLGLEATGTLAILALSAASALAQITQGVREELFDGSVRVTVPGLAFHLIFFKVAAVPFHFWAPDVYLGALAPVAGFMATGTKAAAFAALLRVVTVALQEAPVKERWMAIATILALLTMVVGNVAALAQQNIKRMLAYSSIANAGYLLLAVAAGGATGNGAATAFFYLAAYVLMTSGAFAVALLVGRSGEGDQGYAIASYGGLGRGRPALAPAGALLLRSLTRLPPTRGFLGKLYIFQAAV